MLRYGYTGQTNYYWRFEGQLDTERNTSEFTRYAGYIGLLSKCTALSGSLRGFIVLQPVFVYRITVWVDETDYLIDVAGSLAPKKRVL